MSLIVKETNDKSVYVLSLENNKFYVGISSNVQRRWLQHREGVGALWTRLHKPIKIVTVSRHASSFEEDKLTKLYMSTYGIENVRGGSYISITLSDDQIRAIRKELLFNSNRCIRCEEVGHYVKNCSAPSTPISSPSTPSLRASEPSSQPSCQPSSSKRKIRCHLHKECKSIATRSLEPSPSKTLTTTSDEEEEGTVPLPSSLIEPGRTCICLITKAKTRCSLHHAQAVEETSGLSPGITKEGKQCKICISMISRGSKTRCHIHKNQEI